MGLVYRTIILINFVFLNINLKHLAYDNIVSLPNALFKKKKLKDLIHRKIDPNPNYDKEVVYIIPFCTENQKSLSYVGMISQKFRERLTEHLSDKFIKFNKPSNALSRLHKYIYINFDKAKIFFFF